MEKQNMGYYELYILRRANKHPDDTSGIFLSNTFFKNYSLTCRKRQEEWFSASRKWFGLQLFQDFVFN